MRPQSRRSKVDICATTSVRYRLCNMQHLRGLRSASTWPRVASISMLRSSPSLSQHHAAALRRRHAPAGPVLSVRNGPLQAHGVKRQVAPVPKRWCLLHPPRPALMTINAPRVLCAQPKQLTIRRALGARTHANAVRACPCTAGPRFTFCLLRSLSWISHFFFGRSFVFE